MNIGNPDEFTIRQLAELVRQLGSTLQLTADRKTLAPG